MKLADNGSDSCEFEVSADNSNDPTLADLVLPWAWSHGLFDRFDQSKRLVVLHGARLLDALELEASFESQALVLRLMAWLAAIEHRDDASFLIDYLFRGDGTIEQREEATSDLRVRLVSSALDLIGLEREVRRHQLGVELNPANQAYHWTMVLLEALGIYNEKPTVHNVSFTLPGSWATGINPLAFDVAEKVKNWLRGVGVLRNEADEKTLNDFAVPEYGGWPCPNASFDELYVVTGVFSLWLLHDDVLEGAGLGVDTVLADAICGRLDASSSESSDHYVQGWVDLGTHFVGTMSRGWLDRLYDCFIEWTRSLRMEVDIVRRFRMVGSLPLMSDYLPLRSSTIGMGPTVCLVEYVTGQELPDRVARLPALAEVVKLSGDLVAFPNELLGFSKDTHNRMVNIINCLMAQGRDAPDAFREIASLHDEVVLQYILAERRLIDEVGAEHRPLMMRWLVGLRHLIYGFARWHFIAPRYCDVHRLSDGSLLRVVMNEG